MAFTARRASEKTSASQRGDAGVVPVSCCVLVIASTSDHTSAIRPHPEDVDAGPGRLAAGRGQLAQRPVLCSGRCVPLHHVIVFGDELVERVVEIGKGGEKIAHHGTDAVGLHHLGVTTGCMMCYRRSENFAERGRIALIDHILMPRSRDGGVFNIRGDSARSGCRRLTLRATDLVRQ